MYLEDHMPVMIIDGVKQLKEGRKMPGVKKMHQESENSSKAEYIYGHLFGVIGIVVGTAEKMFCVPVQATIQDGVSIIRKWSNVHAKNETHVVQLVRQACLIASKLQYESILLMDRYFLTKPVLEEWIACEESFGQTLIHLVSKVKSNATVYEKPTVKKGAIFLHGSAMGERPLSGTWFCFGKRHFEMVNFSIHKYKFFTRKNYASIRLSL